MNKMTRNGRSACGVLAVLAAAWLVPAAQRVAATEVGEVATDFTVTHRVSGATRTLYGNYSGAVIVLDFFAHWCGPCKTASMGLKTGIEEYYHDRGGNPHGVSVQVVPVNIQSGAESATDQFIADAGIDPQAVVNDYSRSAYNQFSTGGIPLLVVLNCVDGSTSHAQWQVLYRASGWGSGTAAALRSVIDTVEAADPASPPRILRQPAGSNVMVGQAIELDVLVGGPAPLDFRWFKDGVQVEDADGATLSISTATMDDSGSYTVEVTNVNGTDTSDPALVRVSEPGRTGTFVATQVPVAIPDSNPAGTTSYLPVSGVKRVLGVKLSLTIRHTWIGDLVVKLISPAGTTYTVHNRTGESADDIVITGMELGDFFGEDGTGQWELWAADYVSTDTGVIENWSIELIYYDELMDAYARWIEGYSQLAGSQCARLADPDGDGLVNLLEFMLDGHSPAVPAAGPRLVPAPGDGPGFHEFVLQRRAGVDDAWCRVELSESLKAGGWQIVQTHGDDILVDSPAAGRTRVRINKALPQMFLRVAVPIPAD